LPSPAPRLRFCALPTLDSLASLLIAAILRILAVTWRIEVRDLAGLTGKAPGSERPVIWLLWHNRLIIIPILYERMFRHRKGAALISRSKDGGLLAHSIARFGGESVRGSTSKGGSSALAESKRRIADGYDIYITPDGPRGPRYSLSPGALWLAQSSGAPILPFHVEFSKTWRLGRWDGFMIPKPFARVTVTLGALYVAPETATPEEFERERARLRDLMLAGTVLQ
jgi:lysophospholipid acyltransferase (LPLAT)-like uncharacterized protein